MSKHLTRRNVLAASLVLGLVVLAADQGLLFAPEEASGRAQADAAASESAGAGETTNTHDDDLPPGPDTVDNPRLAWFRSRNQVRDLFAPMPAMLAAVPGGAEAAAGRNRQPQDIARDFAAHHRLQATFTGRATAAALIDGALYQVGDHLDGLKLIEVGPHEASFGQGSVTVVLVMTIVPEG